MVNIFLCCMRCCRRGCRQRRDSSYTVPERLRQDVHNMSWEAVGEFVQSTYPVLCERTQDMWSAHLETASDNMFLIVNLFIRQNIMPIKHDKKGQPTKSPEVAPQSYLIHLNAPSGFHPHDLVRSPLIKVDPTIWSGEHHCELGRLYPPSALWKNYMLRGCLLEML